MNFYPLIFDAAAVLIAALMIGRAYHNGFVRSILLFVGFFAAAAAAVWLSRGVADYVYENFFREAIINGAASLAGDGMEALNIPSLVPGLLEGLPDFIRNSLLTSLGGEQQIAAQITEAVGGSAVSFGEAAADMVIGPVVISFIRMITCLLIFAVCVIIVKIVASLFRGVHALPVIGTIDSVLGALIGLLQAVIVLYVLGLICSVIISMSGNGISWLNTNVMDSTYLFKIFYNFHP